jgi:hypothetical protein
VSPAAPGGAPDTSDAPGTSDAPAPSDTPDGTDDPGPVEDYSNRSDREAVGMDGGGGAPSGHLGVDTKINEIMRKLQEEWEKKLRIKLDD